MSPENGTFIEIMFLPAESAKIKCGRLNSMPLPHLASKFEASQRRYLGEPWVQLEPDFLRQALLFRGVMLFIVWS